VYLRGWWNRSVRTLISSGRRGVDSEMVITVSDRVLLLADVDLMDGGDVGRVFGNRGGRKGGWRIETKMHRAFFGRAGWDSEMYEGLKIECEVVCVLEG